METSTQPLQENQSIQGNLDSNSTTVTPITQDVEYTNTPDKDRRNDFWKLRRFVQSDLATNTSIRLCGKKCVFNNVSLNVSNKTGKSHFDNVYKCKSKICPVCQKQIAHKKIDKMSKVIEHDSMKDFIFITLTGSHSWNTKLSDFHKNMTQSFREIFRGSFKKKLKKYGYFSYIRQVDYTFSKSSKHHIHNHIVLLFSEYVPSPIIQELNDELYRLWSYQMNKRNIETNKSGFYFERVKKGKDKVIKYLIKSGNISFEMFHTFSKISEGQMSYNIWQVLDLFYNTGDLFWKDIWMDYHSEMKNQKMTTYGSEYNKLLNQIESEEEPEDQEIEVLAEINPLLYECLYNKRLCIPLLHSVEIHYNNKKNNINDYDSESRFLYIINSIKELNDLCYEWSSNKRLIYSYLDTFRNRFYKYQYK